MGKDFNRTWGSPVDFSKYHIWSLFFRIKNWFYPLKRVRSVVDTSKYHTLVGQLVCLGILGRKAFFQYYPQTRFFSCSIGITSNVRSLRPLGAQSFGSEELRAQVFDKYRIIYVKKLQLKLQRYEAKLINAVY